ncbi:O-methyltransferase [Drepanopeziza brunnea f. sp. 'multigermtubi' MB_m1]|uniref:O-methyltransferase n=1 Tax=Marssonina brunnea f. sp. multigermtubi (strain MB_m1) TaxID=1072389 RepID=K1XX53_MARBU|nr:O-methyltransferase [Drepanopeziza brunnea f. sp. 'multigermtubi' MB_m1]EKD17354.1 O-methyltransferase [Drepanopeziza brunnea f. sp. 'multigermtubi' MB_m1]
MRVVGAQLSAGSSGISFGRSSVQARCESRNGNRKFGSSRELLSARSSSSSQLVELAATIARETAKLDAYMQASGLPTPSFDVNGPLNFPRLNDEMQKAREEVIKAAKELGDLMTGPTETVRWMAWDLTDPAQSFPVDKTATFSQIAEKVGLGELNVRRFLRHAMTNRIFEEAAPGVVAHTAASRVLAEDRMMNDWVGFCVEDMWPAASQTVPALKRNPSADDMTQTGFCLANNTTDLEPMFTTLGKSPQRARRMGGAMLSLTGGEGYELSHLLASYDWATLDARSAQIVDVGGSHGFACVALAERFPNLTFVVQDLPQTIASAPALAGDLAARIQFQAHDFTQPQPVRGADVYLYRWILHNHSDKYAVNMLRQLIPALKNGARVVINDHCLPEPGTESARDEKIMRTMDLVMLTLLNAQERTEGEFRELFAKTDHRFSTAGQSQAISTSIHVNGSTQDDAQYLAERLRVMTYVRKSCLIKEDFNMWHDMFELKVELKSRRRDLAAWFNANKIDYIGLSSDFTYKASHVLDLTFSNIPFAQTTIRFDLYSGLDHET